MALTEKERSFYVAAKQAGFDDATIAGKIKASRAKTSEHVQPSGVDRFRGDPVISDIKTVQDYKDYLAAGNQRLPGVEAQIPSIAATEFLKFAGTMAGGELTGKVVPKIADKLLTGSAVRADARAAVQSAVPEPVQSAVPKPVSPFDEMTSEIPVTPERRASFAAELRSGHGGDIKGLTDEASLRLPSSTSEEATVVGKPVRRSEIKKPEPERPAVVGPAWKKAIKDVKSKVVSHIKHPASHGTMPALAHMVGIPSGYIAAAKGIQLSAPLIKAGAITADEALARVARAAQAGVLTEQHITDAVTAGVRPALVQGMVERLTPPETTDETAQPESPSPETP